MQCETTLLKENVKQYHFISGLPRSGSTLLSAILNQNPFCSASISQPVIHFVKSIIDYSTLEPGFKHQSTIEHRIRVIQAIFDSYYADSNRIVFDTNRMWTSKLPLIKEIFPDSKVICMVRDIPSILNSFETLFQQNIFTQNKMIPPEFNNCVNDRCDFLMDTNQVVGKSYRSLLEGISIAPEILLLVEFETLVKDPENTMKQIYEFLGLDYFQHNFNRVQSNYPKFDSDVGVIGLHKTKPVVKWNEPKIIIPQQVVQKYSGLEVWRNCPC